jgi:hypothetical protein
MKNSRLPVSDVTMQDHPDVGHHGQGGSSDEPGRETTGTAADRRCRYPAY